MKQRTNNSTAGFSLIEVLVGIAVLGLVTIPVCASLLLSVRMNAHSRDLMNAQLSAASMIETLMAEGIDPLERDTYTRDGVGIKVEEKAGGVYYEVTVTGTCNGQSVALNTMIRAKAPEGGDGT